MFILPHVLKPGTILHERYEIISKIAEGGMAEVYEAYDQILKRHVAIKMMAISLSQNKEAVARFNKEYHSIANFSHENVVRVFGNFESDGRQCIVLELVRGYTLKDRLASLGPCTLSELIYYFRDINQAIIEAHRMDIIHRDIKPENILLSFDGKIRVADFGVAILENSNDPDNNKIIGTSKYMAPEIVQSKSPTKKSDIYALGIMLYELALGSPPFVGKNPTFVAVKHVKEAAIAPKVINPEISQALENIIMKAIAKNPAERYQSVHEFDEDISKLMITSKQYVKPIKIKNVIEVKGKKMKIRNRYEVMPTYLNKKLIIFVTLLIVTLIISFIVILVVF